MANQEHQEGQWQLGEAPRKPAPAATDVVSVESSDLSVARLERPLFAITVEHVAWLTIALYALASRLAMLDARPLAPFEARHALAALDLMRGGVDATRTQLGMSWIDLAEAGLFGALGMGDFTARLAYAISGLVMIACTATMRSYLGRAGAIGLAAMLALSPSVAYFSRSSAGVVVGLAFGLVAWRLALALNSRPTIIRAVGVGLAGSLALSADPSMYAAMGIAAVALGIWGLWEAATSDQTRLRLRLWLARRASLMVTSLTLAIALCIVAETVGLTRSLGAAFGRIVSSNWPSAQPRGYRAGFASYMPPLAFYESLILMLATVGALSMLADGAHRRIARWCALWTAASLAWWLWSPARAPELILQMLIPMAMLASLGLDFLHRLALWRIVRYWVVALMMLAFYAQLLICFFYSAPDTSEAPWARHAVWYWSSPATTIATPKFCAAIADRARAADADIRFDLDAPAVRWYLRDFAGGGKHGVESFTIASCPDVANRDDRQLRLDFEESWVPDLDNLSLSAAIRYTLTLRAWSPLMTRCAAVEEPPTATTAQPAR